LPPPRKFHDNWFMPKDPDQVIYMTEQPVDVKAEGVESYRHYVVNPGFTEDKWVKLAECMPGNRAVVHHIIVYVKPPGQQAGRPQPGELDPRGYVFLAGFAPGTRPLTSPAARTTVLDAEAPLACVLALLLFAPILSPQYIVWMLPFAAVLAARGDRLLGAMTLAISVFTTVSYQFVLSAADGELVGILVVLVRNMLLVALLAVSFQTLTGSRRRAGDDQSQSLRLK